MGRRSRASKWSMLMGSLLILLSAILLSTYGPAGRGKVSLPDCTLIRISQTLAMLSERSVLPAKTSRAWRDILASPASAHKNACVSRMAFISVEEVRYRTGLRFQDRDH